MIKLLKIMSLGLLVLDLIFRRKIILILSIVVVGLVINAKSFALVPNSEVVLILSQFSEGRKTLDDLSSKGILSEIKVLLIDGEELKRRSGHDGGGIRQDPITKKYEILINKDLELNQMAHAIVHEAQHVKDELDFNQLIEKYPELNQMILEVFDGLNSQVKQDFIDKNEKKINYVLLTFFCHERRAYEMNIMMNKNGLKFINQNVINDPLGYIRDHYLANFAFKISDETLLKNEKQCLSEITFTNFIKTISPIPIQ